MKPESRKPLLAGNWKLHNTLAESKALASAIVAGVASGSRAEVVVAPVFTALTAVAEALRGSPIELAAQDCYHEPRGAFTGEVSPALLVDVGCTHVIVGHSERRELFGDSDTDVAKKLRAALGAGLKPIVCVGESLAEREAGQAQSRVTDQIRAALFGLNAADLERVIVAYEPIWAIGTGRTASASDAQEIHALIRRLLGELGGAALAERVRILYGGSVKPSNAAELLGQLDIDGALVGGASLDAKSFLEIVKAAG
jgi:triosephosphate isomerase